MGTNHSSGSGAYAGSLRMREYTDFRGVDFSDRKDEVSVVRSPDMLNMWKNYKTLGKGIETRPDLELVRNYPGKIYGMRYFVINDEKHLIVHSGNKLYKDDVLLDSNMNEHQSMFFIYKSILYILDGQRYLQYDGTTLKEVEGYIPTTTIGKQPAGNGTTYEDINLLTGIRKNTFSADGTSTVYILDTQNIDNNYTPKVTINGNSTNNFTVDYVNGKIIFTTAPIKPDTVGSDNVVITFRKTLNNRRKIENCTRIALFDNRVFFYGNKDYPNMFWHCSVEAPNYISDLDYYGEGIDDAKIKAMIPGNNSLWVIKEPNQNNTSIFYHTPSTDSEYGKIYPNSHSNLSVGCISTGINFGDDIIFFSENGMEGIASSDINSEQLLAHRSSLIDSKLLNEENYKDMVLCKYMGYLLVIIDNKIYLADSRVKSNINGHIEYEWFYWEFNKNISSALVYENVLYLGTEDGVYSLTNYDSDREIENYITTLDDEFGFPQMQKILNKRGCVADVEGEKINVYIKTNTNGKFELFNKYKTKGKEYIVIKAKKKKWKSIQFKFFSNKPFTLYSCTAEAYIGAYIKR